MDSLPSELPEKAALKGCCILDKDHLPNILLEIPFPSSGDLPDPGIEPSLLHFRWILYSLSYQGRLLLRDAASFTKIIFPTSCESPPSLYLNLFRTLLWLLKFPDEFQLILLLYSRDFQLRVSHTEHAFNKCLLATNCMQVVILGTRNTRLNKPEKVSTLLATAFKWQEIKKIKI